MATVTYAYAEIATETRINLGVTAGDQTDPDIAISPSGALAQVAFTGLNFGAGTGADFAVRAFSLLNFSGTQSSALPAPTGAQDSQAITFLSNGDRVIVGRDATAPNGAGGSSVVWGLNSPPNGSTPNIVGDQADNQYDPDVAGLNGDRFVIVWTDEAGAGNTDIRMSVLNNAGDTLIKNNALAAGGSGVQKDASVSKLAMGGFVVSWSDDSAGASATAINARRHDSDGNVVGGVISVIAAGDNEASEVVGLADGGFAVVFRSTGFSANQDVGLRIFNADGTPRTDAFRVNASNALTDADPSITQLGNGFLTVSWTRNVSGSNNDLYMQTYNVTGKAITEEFRFDGSDSDSFNERQSTIAAAPGGRIALAWTDGEVKDDGGSHIAAAIYALQRTWTGDGTDENFIGDDLQDIVFASGGLDVITGQGGDDQLFGQNGDDAIRGGPGADIIDGGGGVDTANYATETEKISLTLNGAFDALAQVGSGSANRDTIRNIENVVGGLNDDTLVGDAFGNNLKGEGGNDFLHSNAYEVSGAIKTNAGDDALHGGSGNDGLFAGDGEDFLDGGDGDDGLVGGAGVDVLLGGIGVDFLFGGAFGPGGAQLLGSGADNLSGGEDKDGLYGFDGADIINGDGGDDYVEGGAGADVVNGGAGNDFLLAQGDADTLSGGGGFDYLYGGAGGDLFIFKLDDSADWILDFSAAEGDKLRFEGFGFANFAAIPLVDLSTPGNPAVQMNFSGVGGVDQLTIFGATLAQLSAANVSVA